MFPFCSSFWCFQGVQKQNHLKSVQIRSYFWSVFPYSVNISIQSKYRNIRTRNNSVYGQFSRSEHCLKNVQIRSNFWSIFSRIRTEYGEILRTEYREILRISLHSVWMRENTDQKLLSIWKFFAQWLWVQSTINLTSVKQRSASIFRALWAKRN